MTRIVRITAAVGGGYALCWSLVVFLCAWLPLPKASLWYLTGQLVPLPLLATLLWAFVAKSAWRALLGPLTLAGAFFLLGSLR